MTALMKLTARAFLISSSADVLLLRHSGSSLSFHFFFLDNFEDAQDR
jgi:hypothetical protein